MLVDLMDSLLQLFDKDPSFWRFMLDGQTAPLEDYLEVRPEKAADIEKYVRGGQLQLGPWYTLADEWLCSPETYIRNAQVGCSIARKFGGAMMVPYLPDIFGHVSQMPQILSGFGFDAVCISRGTLLSKERSQFWWKSPDGTRILCHAQSYGNAAKAFRTEGGDQMLDEIVEGLSAMTTSRHILLMNSGDHHEPVKNLREVIDNYGNTRPHKIIHSTLPAFMEQVKESNLDGIPEIAGEMREGLKASAAYLYDCQSSRIYNKQANQKCANLMEKWAEPLCGIAAILGAEDPRALLLQGWKYLLQNQAHDSICGCSVDRVHDQMMTRFEWTEELANKLIRRAMDSIALRIDGSKIHPDGRKTTVWNPSTFRRSGAVEYVLDTPWEWKKGSPICLVDCEGHRVPAQMIPQRVDEELDISGFTLWSDGKVNPFAFAFIAEDMPALGYRVYGVLNEEAESDSPLKWGSNWAENEYVKFKVAKNGSVIVEDKASGAKFSGVGLFEDGGDRGGGYQFWAPEKDKVITSKDATAKVELVDSGPVLVRFRVELALRIPERLTSRRTGRVSKTVPLKIITYVSLGAKSKSLSFRTIVWNNAVNHRLRVAFPTGLKTDLAHVDTHFDVVERPVAVDKKPWLTEPQRRWVDVSDGSTGLAVINQGLPEYEVTDDKTRTIKLTLFRSNSHVTKEWWGLLKSPQAEMIGKSEYEYAIYAHGGDWNKANVIAEAEAAMLPIKALEAMLEIRGEMDGDMSPELSFVSVEGGAVTSIVKKADNRDSVILRLYNPDKAPTQTTVTLWKPIKEAYSVDLWEERKEKLEVLNGGLELRIPAKKIVTVEMVIG
jgi:alpha-mannosidase